MSFATQSGQHFIKIVTDMMNPVLVLLFRCLINNLVYPIVFCTKSFQMMLSYKTIHAHLKAQQSSFNIATGLNISLMKTLAFIIPNQRLKCHTTCEVY